MYKKHKRPLSFVIKWIQRVKYKDQVFQRLLIERMQQLRAEYGYSQEDVIEYTHLDISRYESGTSMPSTLSILKLCKLYNISISDFFAPINYPSKKEKDV